LWQEHSQNALQLDGDNKEALKWFILDVLMKPEKVVAMGGSPSPELSFTSLWP
jgi:hypothetical protein